MGKKTLSSEKGGLTPAGIADRRYPRTYDEWARQAA
jgi:hypothetical protein